MTCSLSWYRRDPETGKRLQIEFKLIREKPEWKIKRQRNEPRETFSPDDEDWETLLEQMQRNLQRGKVYPRDLEIVRELYQRSRE